MPNGRNEIYRNISIVLNWIWIILIIPMIPVFFMAGVTTMMTTDSGAVTAIPMRMIAVNSACSLCHGSIRIVHDKFYTCVAM
ncbi:MAG: hypothetical protein FWF69_04500 [Firmicutes bacterium]|nr:hypothetical protein [Bacillota bacterium]